MSSAYNNHRYFGKYFQFLTEGNAIAVRLEHSQIDEPTAKTLFRQLVEKLAEEIEGEIK